MGEISKVVFPEYAKENQKNQEQTPTVNNTEEKED